MTTYNHQEWQTLPPLLLRKTLKANTKIASDSSTMTKEPLKEKLSQL